MQTTPVQIYRSVDGNLRLVAPDQPVVRLYRSATGPRIIEPARRQAVPALGHTITDADLYA